MENAAVAMTRWKCHKEVFANKIIEIKKSTSDTLETDRGNSRLFLDSSGYVDVNHSWFDKHKPAVGGYYVRYKDGYESYSPAGAFEEGYTEI